MCFAIAIDEKSFRELSFNIVHLVLLTNWKNKLKRLNLRSVQEIYKFLMSIYGSFFQTVFVQSAANWDGCADVLNRVNRSRFKINKKIDSVLFTILYSC